MFIYLDRTKMIMSKYFLGVEGEIKVKMSIDWMFMYLDRFQRC